MTVSALIVATDAGLASLVQRSLHGIDYLVHVVPDGTAGLYEAATERYQVLVLDGQAPGLAGAEICRQLRQQQVPVTILAISRTNDEEEAVYLLEQGADDCLARPFSPAMLRVRILARLRRLAPPPRPEVSQSSARPSYQVRGEIILNPETYRVTVRGQAVALTPKEFDLLALFMQHPGRVFSRRQLLTQLWGTSYAGFEHTVNSHINRLRLKIEFDPTQPDYILTVWGQGYQFADDYPTNLTAGVVSISNTTKITP